MNLILVNDMRAGQRHLLLLRLQIRVPLRAAPTYPHVLPLLLSHHHGVVHRRTLLLIGQLAQPPGNISYVPMGKPRVISFLGVYSRNRGRRGLGWVLVLGHWGLAVLPVFS